MCTYFCIGFIYLVLKVQALLEYPNLIFPRDYEINDKIILK